MKTAIGFKAFNILILEDEFVISQDVYEILTNEGFKHIKIANTYNQAKIITSTWEPHLLLCDINLSGQKNGIDFATQLKKSYPDLITIFITAFIDKDILQKAYKTKPLNYITKPFTDKQLIIAVKLALNTLSYKTQKEPVHLKDLSKSEIRIIQHIAKGLNSQQIGNLLNISTKTVRNHRYNIAKKLNLPSQKNSLLQWVMKNL